MINNKIILSLLKRIYRIFSKPLRYLKGVPFIFVLKPYVFKIALNSSSNNQLKKEIKLTNKAFNVPPFSRVVVKQNQLVPCIAISDYKEDDTIVTEKMSKMVEFSMQQFEHVEVTSQKKAVTLIKSYIRRHVGEANSKLNKAFESNLESGFFDFTIPYYTMWIYAGDFCLQNAIINNNKLYMIDWEHASENGSVLYDWWFLKRNLYRHNQVNNHDYKIYCSFITENLTKLNVERKQFEAFGHAMHAAVDFSRVKTRGESNAVLAYSIKAMQQIISLNGNVTEEKDYWLDLYDIKKSNSK